MAGLRIAADEAVCIPVGPRATVRVYGGAFGITDTLIVLEARLLRLYGQCNRGIRIDVPGVIELQVA